MQIKADGYSVKIPVGWTARYTKAPQVFIFFSPLEENDTFQENGNLVIEALAVKTSVNKYMKASAAVLEKVYSNFKIVEKKKNYHIISGKINNISLKQMQYFYIAEKEACILTLSSIPGHFDRYRAVFEQIAQTFMY